MDKALFDLSGRAAIVTGGSRGIGRALALGLARQGAAVVVNYQYSIDHARAVVEEIEAEGGRAVPIQADVSQEAETERLAMETLKAFGQIDILVNNAGIIRPGPSEDLSLADWRATMAVNVDGVFLMSRAVGRHMIARRSGSIITVGSMSGRIVNWPFRHTAYNVSKAGVHMLTKGLAVEWAEHNIRVNAIAPGYIRTELTEQVMRERPDVVQTYWEKGAVQNRIGEPAELVGAVVYLASDASSFTTGEVLTVDGGLTLR